MCIYMCMYMYVHMYIYICWKLTCIYLKASENYLSGNDFQAKKILEIREVQ